MAGLEAHASEIADLVTNKLSYKEISAHLIAKYEIERGASWRSVQNLCLQFGITGSNKLTNEELDPIVEDAISQVGPSYGRKMMTGLLTSQGLVVPEKRVGQSLARVNEAYHAGRQQGVRMLNTVPYTAKYYGDKIHLDQNEKLARYGVTHVAAIDGYSGRVVKFATMPWKNNLTIYEDIYRAAVLEDGIWNTVRVDHGAEFNLTTFMQHKNSDKRFNTACLPYAQTQSKKNLKIERLWVEINHRVNYPIKGKLTWMIEENILDWDDAVHRYCVSNLALQIAQIGATSTVNAWNWKNIPKKGIPEHLRRQTKVNPAVSAQEFPPAEEAAALYRADLGATLRPPHPFELSPFPSAEAQADCDRAFLSFFPDLRPVWHSLVNGNCSPFHHTIIRYIELTKEHCNINN